MRIGVHRVDAPFVTRVVVRGAAYAVDRRVAHIDVGAGHVDLGPQHHRAIGVGTVAHRAEDAQVVFGAALAERAVDAGLAKVAAVDAHFLGALFVHVGVASFDQVLGSAVHEVEVIAGLVVVRGGDAVEIRLPVEAQPAHRVEDGVDVFQILFFRIGVVKAHVADTAIVTRQPEVQADALGVSHVQVAIGLGRKARAYARRIGHACCMVGGVAGRAAPVAAGIGSLGQIVLDDLAQEIAGAGWFGVAGGGGRWGTHTGILGGGIRVLPGFSGRCDGSAAQIFTPAMSCVRRPMP